MDTRTLMILLGVVGVAGIGAVILANAEDAPEDDDRLGKLRARVRSHLKIAEDCSKIELVGDEEEYEADLEALMEVVLPVAREQGLTSANELTEFMLVQILPDCVIPPPGGFAARPDLSLLFVNMRGRIVALGEALPDVDDDDEDEGLDAELADQPEGIEVDLAQSKKATFKET